MTDLSSLADATLMDRRRFLAALAGSVVAAGCPLPVGVGEEAFVYMPVQNEWYNVMTHRMLFYVAEKPMRIEWSEVQDPDKW